MKTRNKLCGRAFSSLLERVGVPRKTFFSSPLASSLVVVDIKLVIIINRVLKVFRQH